MYKQIFNTNINNTFIGIIRNSVETLHNFLKKHVLCDFFFIEGTYVKAISDYVMCTIFFWFVLQQSIGRKSENMCNYLK